MNPINTTKPEMCKISLQKYNSYDEEWIKAYFDEFSGGFNVYHKEHKFSKIGDGGKAEKTVGKILAKNGKQVEFLPDNAVIREVGKCTKENRVHELPDIYYIDLSDTLKLLWEK